MDEVVDGDVQGVVVAKDDHGHESPTRIRSTSAWSAIRAVGAS